MAAQAQLIPTPLSPPTPPPPVPSLPPHPPTQDQWGSRPVDPSDKGEGETRRGRGSQPGRRGSSTRAEEEAVQEKH